MTDLDTYAGYRLFKVFALGNSAIVLGENPNALPPYMVWLRKATLDGKPVYTYGYRADTYAEALADIGSRIQRYAESLNHPLRRNNPGERLYQVEDCLPGSAQYCYENQVLVLRPELLRAANLAPERQLFYARTGHGCSPQCGGGSIIAEELYTRQHAQLARDAFLGVLCPELLPAWAEAAVARIQGERDGAPPRPTGARVGWKARAASWHS